MTSKESTIVQSEQSTESSIKENVENETSLIIDTEAETNLITDIEVESSLTTDIETTPIVIEKNFLMTESGKYVYCSSNEGAAKRKEDYKYKDVEELMLVSNPYSITYYVNDEKEKSLNYQMGNINVDLDYVRSAVISTEASGIIAKYNNYDLYNDASGGMYQILTENSQLVSFFNFSDVKQSNTENIGVEQAVQIANSFVIDLLGDEVFNTYTFQNKVEYMFDQYCIAYMKYIHGYPTTDEIIVCVNVDGTIGAYTGEHVSLYDNVNEEVSIDDIINAEDELTETIYSLELPNVNISGHKTIEMNDDGELCIGLHVIYGNERQYYDVFYLKITSTNCS
jgi:hypothetical protein